MIVGNHLEDFAMRYGLVLALTATAVSAPVLIRHNLDNADDAVAVQTVTPSTRLQALQLQARPAAALAQPAPAPAEPPIAAVPGPWVVDFGTTNTFPTLDRAL